MPLGSALAGLGGSLTVGYLIYSLQDSSRTFWRWPGLLGLVILLVGVLVLIAGYIAPTKESDIVGTPTRIKQKQRSGRKSTNYQAAGDITVGQIDKNKKN